jgi:hypothetical protein
MPEHETINIQVESYSSHFLMDRRLGESQIHQDAVAKWKNLTPSGNRTLAILPQIGHFTVSANRRIKFIEEYENCIGTNIRHNYI